MDCDYTYDSYLDKCQVTVNIETTGDCEELSETYSVFKDGVKIKTNQSSKTQDYSMANDDYGTYTYQSEDDDSKSFNITICPFQTEEKDEWQSVTSVSGVSLECTGGTVSASQFKMSLSGIHTNSNGSTATTSTTVSAAKVSQTSFNQNYTDKDVDYNVTITADTQHDSLTALTKVTVKYGAECNCTVGSKTVTGIFISKKSDVECDGGNTSDFVNAYEIFTITQDDCSQSPSQTATTALTSGVVYNPTTLSRNSTNKDILHEVTATYKGFTSNKINVTVKTGTCYQKCTPTISADVEHIE